MVVLKVELRVAVDAAGELERIIAALGVEVRIPQPGWIVVVGVGGIHEPFTPVVGIVVDVEVVEG
jgi:hypothetical protein